MNSVSTKGLVNDAAARHAEEVAGGERFEFGKNWTLFLRSLDEERIESAERSLLDMLELSDLKGLTFLDVGSGSGLFSLAARRLGARVDSFDLDTDSAACTAELRHRFFPGDRDWRVHQGSALDEDFLKSLGKFDIVYSWGVLHHTGDMWRALANAADSVSEGGVLFTAIYNDLGSRSERWRRIKSMYCKLPRFMKPAFAVLVSAPDEVKRLGRFTLNGKPWGYVSHWRDYRNARGMSRWHDIVDWVGGYPYEYAGPSSLFEFYRARGFRLVKMKCDNVGLGCNEMVFRLTGDP